MKNGEWPMITSGSVAQTIDSGNDNGVAKYRDAVVVEANVRR
jgi:hypothetical protein